MDPCFVTPVGLPVSLVRSRPVAHRALAIRRQEGAHERVFSGGEALDARDGFTSKKRFEMYELFSELAGHPNMKLSWMMRPRKDGDAVIGPFMKATALEAVISEMGRLAVQVGEQLNRFFLQTGNKVCRHVSPSSS
jgi:hypothetical protein